MNSTNKVQPRVHVVVIPPSDHGVPDYGNMHIGYVTKVGKKFQPNCRSVDLPLSQLKREAVQSVIDYWEANFSSRALSRRFQRRTVDGTAVAFRHMTENAIVVVLKRPGERGILTSLDAKGKHPNEEGWALIPR